MTTVYFDLETGGLTDAHPDIQLAAIAINGEGVEVGSFEAKLKFDESAADPEALKLNHYDKALWDAEAIAPAEAIRRFVKFIDPHKCVEMISKRTGAPYNVARLAGYNALTFDLPRLKRLFGTQFFPCSYHVRDVLQRTMWYFDEHEGGEKPENMKLSTVCAFFGIEVDGAHDALADVRMSAKLAWRLRQ